MGRFETNWLAKPENLATLNDLSGHWINRVAKRRSCKRIVLDMDSSVSPTHGDQENRRFAIVSHGNGNMSAPVTIRSLHYRGRHGQLHRPNG
jgi:hypothetical protein